MTHRKKAIPAKYFHSPRPTGPKVTTVASDTVDAHGVRHVVLRTLSTAKNGEGYKAAERQAHEWFFRNYDKNFGMPDSLLPLFPETLALAELLLTAATECDYLGAAWLDNPHPVVDSRQGKFLFGPHRGIEPTTTEPAWSFYFQIVPLKARGQNSPSADCPTDSAIRPAVCKPERRGGKHNPKVSALLPRFGCAAQSTVDKP